MKWHEKIIRLRKSEVSVEIISVCNVIENFVEHCIQYLPCSYTNVVTDMLPYPVFGIVRSITVK